MAVKKIELAGIGTVTLNKRRDARSIRLSINARGQVKVSMPYWLPYASGIEFARGRQDWIAEHVGKRQVNRLVNGQTIGKNHRLVFEASPVASKISSRLEPAIVRITHPASKNSQDDSVQQAAQKAAIRALRSEAEELLPPRLAKLAREYGFKYRSVQVKQLTGRWGSCDSHQNITLNLFLMQVSWDLIDYVLFHELTHTTIMRHGPDFWSAMERVLPDTQIRRKAMRQHQPVIGA